MPENEVSLDDGLPVLPQTGTPAPANAGDQPNKQFNAAFADLSGKLADVANNTQLLDRLLDMPEPDLLPWQEVPLPSRGHYYNGRIPNGIVKIRPMGIQADKILATQQLAQTGQSLDYLYDKQVQIPDGMTPGDLLAGDRTFLLYALRGITHGNIYEFMISCPACGGSASHTYNLNDLAGTITVPDPTIGLEPFKVVLPHLSRTLKKEVWVRVRFLRGNDISLMAKRQRFKKRVAPAGPRNLRGQQGLPSNRDVVIDETLTENLNMIVQDFMGEVSDPTKIQALVSRLHSSDTSAIREFLRKYSPGIDTQITLTCPSCGQEFRTELPITESFFRAT